MTISIVMPTKNAHLPWLQKAIGSCCFADEIIIRRDNGLSIAVNLGVIQSSGDYIAILPDDDYFLEGINDAVEIVKTGEFDFVHFPCKHQIEEGDPSGLFDVSPDVTLEQNLCSNRIFGSSFIKRSAWDRLGGYNGDICMDWDLFNRALAIGMKFKYSPTAGAVFRWNKRSALQNQSAGKYPEIRRYIENSLAKWREANADCCAVPNMEV
jgi:glycosyltransferase involved in cell wall biosynthesis